MHPTDFEIYSLTNSAKLAFQFSSEEDQYRFVHQYFKENMKNLSNVAVGKINLDFKFNNVAAFSKAYNECCKRLESILAIRYIASTLAPEERLNSVVTKLQKYKILVDVQLDDGPFTLNEGEARFGHIHIKQIKTNNSEQQIAVSYFFPAPAMFHVMKEVFYSFGFMGEFPAYKKNTANEVLLTVDDATDIQRQIIKVGQGLAKEQFPQEKFE